MTNRELILATLRRRGPMTDSQLRQDTGIEPHQQVNQICRRLEGEGLLERQRAADGRIRNILTETSTVAGTERQPDRQRPTGPTRSATPAQTSGARVHTEHTTFVISCSGKKVPGGVPGVAAHASVDLLPDGLAERLVTARARIAHRARVDESRLLPAWQRYAGAFYSTAMSAFRSASATNRPMIILSGGYGVLVPNDLIGRYDRMFSLGDWPVGLLQDCLIELVRRLGTERVLALCARTTEYAELVRQTGWSRAGIAAFLASPDMGGRGGAQRAVPVALGEAFSAAIEGRLTDTWISKSGFPLLIRKIP
jgi:hypothetical protein